MKYIDFLKISLNKVGGSLYDDFTNFYKTVLAILDKKLLTPVNYDKIQQFLKELQTHQFNIRPDIFLNAPVTIEEEVKKFLELKNQFDILKESDSIRNTDAIHKFNREFDTFLKNLKDKNNKLIQDITQLVNNRFVITDSNCGRYPIVYTVPIQSKQITNNSGRLKLVKKTKAEIDTGINSGTIEKVKIMNNPRLQVTSEIILPDVSEDNTNLIKDTIRNVNDNIQTSLSFKKKELDDYLRKILNEKNITDDNKEQIKTLINDLINLDATLVNQEYIQEKIEPKLQNLFKNITLENISNVVGGTLLLATINSVEVSKLLQDYNENTILYNKLSFDEIQYSLTILSLLFVLHTKDIAHFNFIDKPTIQFFMRILKDLINKMNNQLNNSSIIYDYKLRTRLMIEKMYNFCWGIDCQMTYNDYVDVNNCGEDIQLHFKLLFVFINNINQFNLKFGKKIYTYIRINDYDPAVKGTKKLPDNLIDELEIFKTPTEFDFERLQILKDKCCLNDYNPCNSQNQTLMFDGVFHSNVFSNEDLAYFMRLQEMLTSGLNCFILTFGYSGTGKTFTIKDLLRFIFSNFNDVEYEIFEIYGLGLIYKDYWKDNNNVYKNTIVYKYIINQDSSISVQSLPEDIQQRNISNYQERINSFLNKYLPISKDLLSGFDSIMNNIDTYRKMNSKTIKSHDSNPESSRSLLVLSFRINIDGKYRYLTIFDMPGRESIVDTYIDTAFTKRITTLLPEEKMRFDIATKRESLLQYLSVNNILFSDIFSLFMTIPTNIKITDTGKTTENAQSTINYIKSACLNFNIFIKNNYQRSKLRLSGNPTSEPSRELTFSLYLIYLYVCMFNISQPYDQKTELQNVNKYLEDKYKINLKTTTIFGGNLNFEQKITGNLITSDNKFNLSIIDKIINFNESYQLLFNKNDSLSVNSNEIKFIKLIIVAIILEDSYCLEYLPKNELSIDVYTQNSTLVRGTSPVLTSSERTIINNTLNINKETEKNNMSALITTNKEISDSNPALTIREMLGGIYLDQRFLKKYFDPDKLKLLNDPIDKNNVFGLVNYLVSLITENKIQPKYASNITRLLQSILSKNTVTEQDIPNLKTAIIRSFEATFINSLITSLLMYLILSINKDYTFEKLKCNFYDSITENPFDCYIGTELENNGNNNKNNLFISTFLKHLTFERVIIFYLFSNIPKKNDRGELIDRGPDSSRGKRYFSKCKEQINLLTFMLDIIAKLNES